MLKGGGLLTSASRRGVPGMEPYAELARVFGGVRMRRPYLSNLAGEAVRDMNEEPVDAAEPPDPVRLWLRRPGRPAGCSGCLADSAGGGAGLIVLLALTRALAAWVSCCWGWIRDELFKKCCWCQAATGLGTDQGGRLRCHLPPR